MIQFVGRYTSLSIVMGGLALLTACANIASPSGGEYDLDPPKVVRSSPAFNATNVTRGRVTIDFDENVTIEKPSENVIITPPQQSFPDIVAANRRVTVTLRDTLIPNTTYTIDFTDAIVDNNEKNALENFSFSFSTGNHVDTLTISGKVLAADNLEPVKGMYVGLHSNLNDTAFTRTKFLRISRTNDRGMFVIRGVAPGKYRIYALDDANRDYMYDNPAEAIAFLDAIIEPYTESASRMDTTFLIEGEKRLIDTVKTVQYTRFLPDDILLRSFKSDFKRKYLQKYERTANKLSLYFGAPTEMPKMEPFNFEGRDDWYVLEKTPNNDTLTYWFKEQSINNIDTLSFKATYLKSDSLNQPVLVTDTLHFVDRGRKDRERLKENKKKDKDYKEDIVFLDIKHNLSSSWDPYREITFEFSEPLDDSIYNKIRLQSVKDSVYTDMSFVLLSDSLNPRKFSIKNRWGYGNEYRIQIDSASIYSIYGLWNDKLEQTFKVKNEDQYSQLAIRVRGIDSIPSFIELLDKSDKPVRKSRVIDHIALFKDVDPGTYYARITLDTNNNGVWDTGDFFENRQPEVVCYREKYFELKAYFELEEEWTIDTTTLATQKPLEITKNKPQERESKRRQLEKQEQNQQKQNNRNNNLQTGTNQSNNNMNNQTGSQF